MSKETIICVELPTDVILALALQAHELNITLNEHIVNALLEESNKVIDQEMFRAIEEIGRDVDDEV